MNPVSGNGGGAIDQVMALRQQIIDRTQVLQELHQDKTAAPTETQPAQDNGGFADSLRSALDGVNAAQTRSGEITAAYERGEETDIAKVMLARQESSVAFEATLQVRNKLLSAYQEIMRMGV